jgi:hypothetical protein
MILEILLGESYSGIRAFTNLSVCVNLYQQALDQCQFDRMDQMSCHMDPMAQQEIATLITYHVVAIIQVIKKCHKENQWQ